jgi:hypothetical protein
VQRSAGVLVNTTTGLDSKVDEGTTPNTEHCGQRTSGCAFALRFDLDTLLILFEVATMSKSFDDYEQVSMFCSSIIIVLLAFL